MSWVIATTVRPDRVQPSTIPPTRRTPGPVLPGCRLVEDEDRRIHRQDAGQGDELAQRQVEVVRVDRARRLEPDRGEGGVGGPPDRIRRAPQVPRAEGDLPLDRSVEQLVVRVLEDEPDRGGQPVDRHRPDVGPVERHPAVCRPEEPVEMLDERRLARPVLADDRDRLARLDDERHAAQGLDAGRVAMGQVLHHDPDARAVGRGGPAGDRLTGPGRLGTVGRARVRRPTSRPALDPGERAGARRPRRRPSRGSSPAASARRTSVGAVSPMAASRSLPSARPGHADGDDPSAVEEDARSRPPRIARVVLGAQDRRCRRRASSASRAATDAVPAGSSCAVGSSSTR